MSEIKAILNKAFELYSKHNSVLAAMMKEKHFYNDRDDKKSLITKLILIEKGLMHD